MTDFQENQNSYGHRLAGRRVTITREGPHYGRTFTVRRVMGSRFGGLAVDDAEPATAWSVADVEVVSVVARRIRAGSSSTARWSRSTVVRCVSSAVDAPSTTGSGGSVTTALLGAMTKG